MALQPMIQMNTVNAVKDNRLLQVKYGEGLIVLKHVSEPFK